MLFLIKSLSVVKLFKFKELLLEFSNPELIHADGEIISEKAIKIKINVLPNSIKMIYI